MNARTLLIMGVLLLSGCAKAHLEELRHATPTGDPFQTALSKLYLVWADSEAKQYDWVDAQYFADKGLHAAYGHETPPEELKDWKIEDTSTLPQLEEARAKLVSLLTRERRAVQPMLLAKTQVYFDCWVEQQEEGHQADHISRCKVNFYSMVNALAVTEETTIPEPVIATSYIVLFGWNSATLNENGKLVIDTMISELKGQNNYEVVLNGHSDRSGEEGYNLELSQKRVDTVRSALLQNGIPRRVIKEFAFGESDPKVPTKDGSRNQANRRVEIFIND